VVAVAVIILVGLAQLEAVVVAEPQPVEVLEAAQLVKDLQAAQVQATMVVEVEVLAAQRLAPTVETVE
jgi:hypothetical protein